MAVSFRFSSERPLDHVGFAWSPLFEAVLSLPTLAHPKRTPMFLPWVRRCRDLSPDLLKEIDELFRPFVGFVPGIFEVGFLGNRPTFEAEVAALRGLPAETVAHELSLCCGGLGCGHPASLDSSVIHDRDYRDDTIALADDAGHGHLARAAFEDPEALRDRYAVVLERYWEEAFREEWERLLPRIEAEVTDGARTLVTRGAPGLVEELLPEGRWDAATSSIVIERKWDGTVDVAERGGLLFVPTVFGWPKVLIELAEPWALAIMVPLRDLRQPEVPSASDHEVADGLRALGDETRLQIARLVAEQPRSTKELAELLKLSDSAVNRHLKILDAAGVVMGERDGYFVLYRLRPERIGQLGGALRHTLGLAASSAGGQVPALPVSLGRTGVG